MSKRQGGWECPNCGTLNRNNQVVLLEMRLQKRRLIRLSFFEKERAMFRKRKWGLLQTLIFPLFYNMQ